MFKKNRFYTLFTLPSIFLTLVILLVIAGYSDNNGNGSPMPSTSKTAIDTQKVCKLNKLCKQLIEIKGEYAKADSIAHKTILLAEKANYKRGLADAYNYLGENEWYQNKYPAAIESYMKAQKIGESIDYKYGLSRTWDGLGEVYESQDAFDQALVQEQAALKISTEIKDSEGIASVLTDIAQVYLDKRYYSVALHTANKSYSLFERLKDKEGMFFALDVIGNSYAGMDDYENALKYSAKLKEMSESFDNKKDKLMTLHYHFATILFRQKSYKEAIQYANQSIALAKEISSRDNLKDGLDLLSKIYKQMGNEKDALRYRVAYDSIRDSIFSQENLRKTVGYEMNYQYEKKQEVVKAANDKKEAVHQEETRRQRTIIYFVCGILLLSFAFAGFAYRSYSQKQQANKLIAQKNHEITDSITYAQRIQKAMLPDKEDISKWLPQSFILFKPKDIVSGDFYFFSKQNGTTMIAAADCTGHGVPGALMSMIGMEKLQDAVEQSTNPADILSGLNKGIKKSLHQSEKNDSTRDGMDIAFCSMEGNKLNYSGANRPLWLIRNNSDIIEEVKPTKRAIGGFTEEEQPFEFHTLDLQSGDTFYLFSDGYADQFGGPKGKKLTTKKFKDALLSLKNKRMDEQGEELEKVLQDWKKKEEQVDDILVIGVRI